LHERFSTALYARGSNDPFATSAVADAESAATKVDLGGRFPVKFPRPAIGTGLIAAAALGVWAMSPMDLFGHREAVKAAMAVQSKKIDDVTATLRKVEAAVDSAPASVANLPEIKKAHIVINDLLNHPMQNPDQARRDALDALQQMQAAIKEEIKNNSDFAAAQDDAQTFSNLSSSDDPSTPIGAAQQDMKNGNFTSAVKDIQAAVQKFDKSTPEQQKDQAQQMQNLAKQLQTSPAIRRFSSRCRTSFSKWAPASSSRSRYRT
jgi:hypothetical protein